MGLFDRGGGQDAGNVFQNGGAAGEVGPLSAYGLRMGMADTMGRQQANTYGSATNQVQGNPILSKLFGQGGQMDQADKSATELNNRGYSLQPEDHEAYGQASGNIARLFGGQEQGLAQDMANRGLSTSGVAGQQFSNMYGNKQEQLGQLQTQIAQNRMQMNQQRLQEMHNFLGTLGGQAQNAIGQAHDITGKTLATDMNNRMGLLEHMQGQSNEAMSQRQGSQTPSTGDMISGGLGIGSQAAGLASGISGMGGDKKSPGIFAGESSSKGRVLA